MLDADDVNSPTNVNANDDCANHNDRDVDHGDFDNIDHHYNNNHAY
jgi:hypothetical protein